MKMRVITRNDIFDHNYCKSYDIVSSLICIIIDHMYVQINSCINKLCHRQWRIQGGALGASAPPSNKSSTYINIRFSRLVNVTIWLLIEWFRSV
jgi:hypothetical protein